MTKRVQLVRHDNAGTQLFLGKLGELTVNTGNKSVVVHDGINLGGTEQARADLVNVPVAAAGNAGKMSAQMSVDLAQALLDIVTNATDIASNDTDILNLQNTKANKLVPATTNNFAMLNASGDLADSGVIEADLFKLPGGGVNFMLFQQTTAPAGWTKQTTHNDKALRVVSGTAGNGGTNSFSTALNATFASDSYTLLEADIPAHDHGSGGSHSHSVSAYDNGLIGPPPPIQVSKGDSTSTNHTFNTNVAGAHTHTSFGGGGGHSHGVSLDIQYVDLIIASKD
ncbi:MAG TPA: hypothetical protein ENJ28_04865 [Gammaproteobacteria bacterium]|nr:hypothetical protein [Gammaproteobacteria bacterium]